MKKIGVILGYKSTPEAIEKNKATLEVPSDTELVVVGAQDGMSDDELREMGEGVEPGLPHVDTLSDGTMVHLRKSDVMDNMRKKAEELREQGAVASLINCTMDYSDLQDIENLLIPSRVIENATLALIPKGSTIGVLNPIEATMDYEVQKWKELKDYKVVNRAATPVTPGSPETKLLSENELATARDRPVQAAKELVAEGADIIVMDCMGYTKEHREAVHQATGKPVIHPKSILGKTLESIYCL